MGSGPGAREDDTDASEYEDIYIPNPADEARHAEERRARDEAAWAASEDIEPTELTLYDGSPIPEPPPLYPGQSMDDFFVPAQGSLAQLLLTRGKPDEASIWACDNVWKPGSLTLIVGAQQSFKSWAMFDLMYSAASNGDWLDRELTTYDAVVYVSNEKSYSAIYERLWLLFQHDLRLANKVYVKHREDRIHFGNEQWDEFVKWMHEDLYGERVLVILDTLTSLAPSGYDENNLKDVSKVLQAIRDLQQGSRMDIMLVHHLNALGERPRGHTALDGEVDGFVKFDRRGRDIDEVMVRFEPKDGLPSVGTYTFDPSKGMFKRAMVKALHIGNLVNVVQWYMDRNNGEGITIKRLKEQFFQGYRYDVLNAEVNKAVDALVLKRETKTSMLTNREADLVFVMSEEERDEVRRLRRKVAAIETEVEARAAAEAKALDLLDRRSKGALKAIPKVEEQPVLFEGLEA